MNKDWANYWAKSRESGARVFILKRGTALGLVMFGLLIVVPRVFMMVDKPGLPVWQFCLFMALGFLLGWFLWVANERSYHKFNRLEAEQAKANPQDEDNS